MVAQGDSPVTANTIQDGNVSSGTTNLTITSLTPETPYDIYIQTNCANNESEWEGPISFTTTEITCETPQNLSVDEITGNLVEISWTEPTITDNINTYNWITVVEGNNPENEENIVQEGSVTVGTHTLTLSNLDPGTYDLYLFADCNENLNEALIITFEVESLSVSTIEGLDTIKIYPNPAKHDFYIETTTVLEKIELFDLNGRRIFSKNEHTKQFHFDISELATGVYLLKIQAGTDTKVYRLVKE